jgi:hypothetical protein
MDRIKQNPLEIIINHILNYFNVSKYCCSRNILRYTGNHNADILCPDHCLQLLNFRMTDNKPCTSCNFFLISIIVLYPVNPVHPV